ncbi:MAG: branched-chain-amino-acid transaminase [Fimbriimonadaceae bacterium]|nr:branched-chain-amino-acid transaminase [Fimbriimonadaceae bacterium]
MPKLVWLNGEVTPLEDAKTHVSDHAHLYGDGLFEGIRFYGRKIFKFHEHMERLYHGIGYLGYNMHISREQLTEIVLDTCKQADLVDGYIRLNVTRGYGLGLDPKAVETPPSVMVMVSTLALYPRERYETGLTVMTSPFRVIPPDSLDPRLKCIGRYASNILAKQYANRIGAGDALLLNHQGQVAEGTGNNIFIARNGTVHTPHPSCGILQGITRNSVIEMARKDGITVVEDFLSPMDFYAADEAFFTGTATEVMPMVSLDGNKIGCGKPGPITQRMMELFQEAILDGTPF